MFKRLTLELTNICDLSCKMCPRHHVDMPYGHMSYTLFYKLIQQIPRDTIIIPFWRGELFLMPSVSGYLQLLVDMGFDVLIATNGHFLSHRTLPPNILHRLRAISVSLHDIDSCRGYKWLTDQIYDSDGPEIQATLVEGEDINIPSELLSTIDLRIYRQHTLDGTWGQVSRPPPEKRFYCIRLNTDLIITWDGKVSRCCYVWDTIPGLDANVMSLEDIWNSPQLTRIRENYPDEVCEQCDQWYGAGKTL